MKKVDFLLIYEHKMRELESLCLLKCELERKGYKTDIVSCVELQYVRKPIYKAEVVILPGCADNKSVDFYVGRFVIFNKIISMQREQIINKVAKEDKSGWSKLAGIGKNAFIFSWSEQNRKWLIENEGCSYDHAKVVGNISMDFCKSKFKRFYYDREKIAEKYNIDNNKKWITFISSFSLVGMSNEEMDALVESLGMNEYYQLYDVSVISQREILKWFSTLLEKEKETIIIYRPHPGEKINQELNNMISKYNNFKVILGESVQQWIHISDKIYTWISTSLADAMFCKIPCFVLRPYDVPDMFEIELYREAQFISSEADFINSIDSNYCYYPISLEELKKHYYFDEKRYTYEEQIDMCENIFESEKYRIPTDDMIQFKKYQNNRYKNFNIKTWLRGCKLYRYLYYFIINNCKIKKFDNKRQRQEFRELKNNREIEDICKRICECLYQKG